MSEVGGNISQGTHVVAAQARANAKGDVHLWVSPEAQVLVALEAHLPFVVHKPNAVARSSRFGEHSECAQDGGFPGAILTNEHCHAGRGNAEAAWPEDTASAATPPSSAATRSSRMAQVGFMMRL